jgi:hypothetical protein
LVAALLLALSYSAQYAGAGHDDTWISMFVAEHVGQSSWLVNHNFVRQEMATSLLAPLWGALWLGAFPHAADSYGLWKVGMLVPAIVAAGLLGFRVKRLLGPPWSVMFILMLGAIPQWGYWAWAGMENGLYSLTLTGVLFALLSVVRAPAMHKALALGIALFLFNTARADAFWSLILPWVLIPFFPAARRTLLVGSGLGMALVLLMIVARWWMTGAPLPNPVYAKVSIGLDSTWAGLSYLLDFYQQSAGHWLLALAYPCAGYAFARFLFAERDEAHTLLALCGAIVACIDTITVLSGGDWMSMHRFAARSIEWKLILILGTFAIHLQNADLSKARRHMISAGGICIFLVFLLSVSRADGVTLARGRKTPPAHNRLTIAEWIRQPQASWIKSNVKLLRDHNGVRPLIIEELEKSIQRKIRIGAKFPFRVASYQAGYFPYQLRKLYSPSQVLFVDMAGLSERRIGALPGAKSPFGRIDGASGWSTTIAFNQGPLGQKLKDCTMDFVYVLSASDDETERMRLAGYTRVHRRDGAVIFERSDYLARESAGCDNLLR